MWPLKIVAALNIILDPPPGVVQNVFELSFFPEML